MKFKLLWAYKLLIVVFLCLTFFACHKEEYRPVVNNQVVKLHYKNKLW